MGDSLAGRVALITGASRGLGSAIAQAFAEEGARVAVMARSAEPLQAVARETGALAVVGDVAEPDQVEQVFTRVENELGPVDILINNAAVLGPAEAIDQADFEAWTETYWVNVFGTFACTK